MSVREQPAPISEIMREVALGVLADIHDTPQGMYIPLVQAQNRGNGDVGRWIDSLPHDRRIVFPCVLSARLVGMLRRREFHVESEWAADFGEWVECWVREAPE